MMVYFKLVIPKTAYPNLEADVSVTGVANVLICHEKMENDLAYQIVKVLLEKNSLTWSWCTKKRLTLPCKAPGSVPRFHFIPEP